jgi:hypothetical protein
MNFGRFKSSSEKWIVVSDSVIGASHLRHQNIPNQDAFKNYSNSLGRPVTIAAVADGHGSSLHFRSDKGSPYACETLVSKFKQVVRVLDHADDSSFYSSAVLEQLPRSIQESWRENVLEHYNEHPFNPDIYRLLQGSLVEVLHNPVIAYGSTLLGAVVTQTYFIFVQIGDGNILAVSRNGTVKQVFQEDEDIIVANSTHSLCSDDMLDYFKVSIFKRGSNDPVLISLSTDGYRNSFKTIEGFMKTGSDYLKLLREEGPEVVQSELAGFLRKASDEGCGDDTTLALMYCMSGKEKNSHSSLLNKMKRTITRNRNDSG